MAILQTRDISYSFQDGEKERKILKKVNVEFDKGKFYTILGQSGSGKTTLLSLLAALDAPKSGKVLYKGKDIEKIGREAFRRNDVSIIFQNYNLVPYLTAYENVLVPMSTTDNKLPEDKSTVAYNLLDFIGIDKTKANRVVSNLSGGEQQRIAIARALASNSEIILADEPTGNLDETLQDEMVDIFQRLAHEHGKCVIVVTHSSDIAAESDQSFYLRHGILSKEQKN